MNSNDELCKNNQETEHSVLTVNNKWRAGSNIKKKQKKHHTICYIVSLYEYINMWRMLCNLHTVCM